MSAETVMGEWEVSLLFEVLMLRVSSKRMGKVGRSLKDMSKCTQQDRRGAEVGSPQETEEGWSQVAERVLLKFKT